jgi:hypothetical protein
MEIRLTKHRVALAAIFVLAGVGLASLLSPLVGTALATAGQIVNISDRSGSPNFAKVDAGGKLAVGDGGGSLTVDGKVADANLATAYRATVGVNSGNCSAVATAPAGKAIVLTSIDINAYFILTSGTPFLRSSIGASDCLGATLADHDFTERGERQLTFNPGVVIRSGQSLAMSGHSMSAVVLATGYIVPASAVPPAAEHAQATNVPTRNP